MKLKLDDTIDTVSSSEDNASMQTMSDDGYYHIPEPEPISIPIKTEPKKREIHISKAVIIIPIIIIAILLLKQIPFNKKTSLDSIARLPQSEIEKALNVTLSENPNFVSKLSIPNGDAEGFQVYTTQKEDFGVIYYNGQQYGICFTNPKYTLYGTQIHDAEIQIFTEENMNNRLIADGENAGYAFTNYFTVLNDIASGRSTASYVLGTDGSVLVLVFNDTTHRIVSINYYYDSERILKDLSF